MTKQQEEALAAELLEIELDLTVPDGWCHKCGRCNPKEMNHG